MKNIGATFGHIRDTRTMPRQQKHLVTGKLNYWRTNFISDSDCHRHDSSYFFHLDYLVPAIKKRGFCSPCCKKKEEQQEEMHFEVTEVDDSVRLAIAHINRINGIEGFWSYAKTWLYHYRGVPKQYFHLYLKEIEFRFNHRQEDVFRVLTNIIPISCKQPN